MTQYSQGVPSPFFDTVADVEATCREVAVGGLLAEHGLWKANTTSELPGMTFGRLVELWRRSQGWTVETFAREADVGVEDLLLIEHGASSPPEPRTVFQLAKVTHIPVGRLMELAGLATPRDPRTQIAALRFAAQSESMDKLAAHEELALHDLIRALSDAHREQPGNQ